MLPPCRTDGRWGPTQKHPFISKITIGKNTWYACNKCSYISPPNRFVHAGSHYNRIHLEGKKPMPGKRFYKTAATILDLQAKKQSKPSKRPPTTEKRKEHVQKNTRREDIPSTPGPIKREAFMYKATFGNGISFTFPQGVSSFQGGTKAREFFTKPLFPVKLQ